jgi:hypothetical protein
MTDLDKAIRRCEELLKALPPGSLSCEGHGDKWRVMYDLKAQYPKHWDQDDEAFRNGGWKPLDLSTEDRARFIASAPELVRAALEVIKAAREYSDYCPCVGLTYHGSHTNRCIAVREALTAFGERVGGDK